jgi:hypothetical protein
MAHDVPRTVPPITCSVSVFSRKIFLPATCEYSARLIQQDSEMSSRIFSATRPARYPSTGVVVRVVACGGCARDPRRRPRRPAPRDERRAPRWGGAEGGQPAARGDDGRTLPNDASSYTRPHAHAPPTRMEREGSTQRPTAPQKRGAAQAGLLLPPEGSRPL